MPEKRSTRPNATTRTRRSNLREKAEAIIKHYRQLSTEQRLEHKDEFLRLYRKYKKYLQDGSLRSLINKKGEDVFEHMSKSLHEANAAKVLKQVEQKEKQRNQELKKDILGFFKEVLQKRKKFKKQGPKRKYLPRPERTPKERYLYQVEKILKMGRSKKQDEELEEIMKARQDQAPDRDPSNRDYRMINKAKYILMKFHEARLNSTRFPMEKWYADIVRLILYPFPKSIYNSSKIRTINSLRILLATFGQGPKREEDLRKRAREEYNEIVGNYEIQRAKEAKRRLREEDTNVSGELIKKKRETQRAKEAGKQLEEEDINIYQPKKKSQSLSIMPNKGPRKLITQGDWNSFKSLVDSGVLARTTLLRAIREYAGPSKLPGLAGAERAARARQARAYAREKGYSTTTPSGRHQWAAGPGYAALKAVRAAGRQPATRRGPRGPWYLNVGAIKAGGYKHIKTQIQLPNGKTRSKWVATKEKRSPLNAELARVAAQAYRKAILRYMNEANIQPSQIDHGVPARMLRMALLRRLR